MNEMALAERLDQAETRLAHVEARLAAAQLRALFGADYDAAELDCCILECRAARRDVDWLRLVCQQEQGPMTVYMQPRSTSPTNARRRAMNGTNIAIATLQENGFTPQECERLIALRERVRQGRYPDDGPGGGTGDPGFDRRLTFVRWLVQHDKLAG